MLDNAVRISVLLLSGVTLALVLSAYLRFCFQEILGTGEIVIDPITVIDDAGKKDDSIGAALALMLQARLESLVAQLDSVQGALKKSGTASAAEADVSRVGDVRLWTQNVALHTGLLRPVDLKLSVGGVDVGLVLPWIQRSLSSRRTLHFTVYTNDTGAQVFGSVAALRLKGDAVRLVIAANAGKSPSFDAIVDRLAHEIIRRRLAGDSSNRVALLSVPEFETLTAIMVSAADSNKRSVRGLPVQNDFAELVPRITALADGVPDWPELSYFAAWIADKARDAATATKYYQHIAARLDKDNKAQADLLAFVNGRITALAPPAGASVADGSVALPPPLTATLDYSSKIPAVRDQGPEASVVGQALATALEFQIKKTTGQDHPISARYIYYAARQASGSTATDSGALISDALRVLTKTGAVEEAVWPYVPGQFAAKPPAAVETAQRFRVTDVKAVKGLEGIKRALATNGPVLAGIEMYESSMTPQVAKTGRIPMPAPKAQIVGGHAIVIVGYDDASKELRFVNSWGAAWGDHGFGYLPYDYVEKHLSDAWTFKAAHTTAATDVPSTTAAQSHRRAPASQDH
jgi:hypothetical protein